MMLRVAAKRTSTNAMGAIQRNRPCKGLVQFLSRLWYAPCSQGNRSAVQLRFPGRFSGLLPPLSGVRCPWIAHQCGYLGTVRRPDGLPHLFSKTGRIHG